MVSSGVGGGESGGHWPPRLVSKCQNFTQLFIIWAILHQNFGQFCTFLDKLRQNFGQFDIHQTGSISVKTFLFFWKTEKLSQFQ